MKIWQTRSRRSKLSLEERFWEKVDRSGGPDACWPWMGNCISSGYGLIKRGAPSRDSETAHRVAYTVQVGEIPDGKEILHRCDNPPCCNGAHLYAGTQKENNLDAYARERRPRLKAANG